MHPSVCRFPASPVPSSLITVVPTLKEKKKKKKEKHLKNHNYKCKLPY